MTFTAIMGMVRAIARAISAAAEGVKSFFVWLNNQQQQDYGRLKAEKEGREHVEDFDRKLDHLDTDSVSDDELTRRNP